MDACRRDGAAFHPGAASAVPWGGCRAARLACKGSAMGLGGLWGALWQVLSDDEKRALYDQYGEAGAKGGPGMAGAGGAYAVSSRVPCCLPLTTVHAILRASPHCAWGKQPSQIPPTPALQALPGWHRTRL